MELCCSLPVITNKKLDIQKLEYLFPLDSKTSRVNFVRIATYLDGLDVSYEIALELIKKGFDVSVNLMQIQNADEKVLKDFGEVSKKINLKVFILRTVLVAFFQKMSKIL